MAKYFPATEQPVGRSRILLQEQGGGTVRRTVLPGGLRVLTEEVPGSASVTIGAWVGAGSRDETPQQHGAAHYLEHLLFKATKRRSALELAALIDGVGGDMNAFTAREFTCYYARVIDRDLPLAVDVILDVVGAALMRDEDVDAERGVVLEEIAMHEDDPGDVAQERFFRELLADEALARPILGTTESISGLPAEAIRDFYRTHYRPENIVIAASGGLTHRELVRLVREQVAGFGWLDDEGTGPAPLRAAGEQEVLRGADTILRRPTEQIHMVIGGRGVSRRDPDRFAAGVLTSVLGGGMSSRLFHRVREERGLAYSVYCFNAPFSDVGLFGVYAGSLPDKAEQAAEVIEEELQQVIRHGLTAEEYERGRGQLRGSIVLAMEDNFSRMNRLGRAELVVGEMPGIAEIHQRIDAVSRRDVAAVAERILGSAQNLIVVGPIPENTGFAGRAA